MYQISVGDVVVERNTEFPLMMIRGNEPNENMPSGYDPDRYVCEFEKSSNIRTTKILDGHDIVIKERANDMGQYVPIEEYMQYHRGNTALKIFTSLYVSRYPDRDNDTADEFFNDTRNSYLAQLKSIYANPLPEALLNQHLLIYNSTLQSWTNEGDDKAAFI